MSIITEKHLPSLTDSLRYQRGREYFNSGAVTNLREYRGRISATVTGSENYRVRLWEEDGQLEYECSCPDGQDYEFCKHCVAAGLAWLEQTGTGTIGKNQSGRRKPGKKGRKEITAEDIRGWLQTQDVSVLADLLMEQAIDDQRLYGQLKLQVASDIGGDTNISIIQKALKEAILPGYFINYQAAYGYASNVEIALDSVETLLKDDQAEAVIQLTEFALRKAEEALDSMDDSDGHMRNIFERLQTLHLDACSQAKPDPEALARRLFEWEMNGEWDVFSEAASRYAEVLGERGLTFYRELAQAEWHKVKPLSPSAGTRASYDSRRFNITHIMETLAEQTDDVEALVEVLSRDLSHSYSFLRIAEAYKKAGKHNKALDWAERGLKAFAKTPDQRLQEFVADEYHRLKRHDEAMSLMWRLFTDQPGLESYRELKQHADRCKQWPDWRSQALDHLHQLLEKKPAKRQPGNFYFSYARGSRPTLVKIYLWEKNVDAAWELAQDADLHDELWLQLAAQREKQHPEDAIQVYRNLIESSVNQTNNAAYAQAVNHLKKVEKLMKKTNRENAFKNYLSGLRTTYKRKRNFIAMINKL